MRTQELISSSPISVEKTVRGDEIRALTSCKAGRIVPLAYVPLLREDAVTRGQVSVSLKMAETIHPLMNSINVTVYAHFVPFLAFERFRGMDSLNRSYQGQPETPGGADVIPFFETTNFVSTHQVWRKLGVHWVDGQPINAAPVEAYNAIVNFRRQARSQHLPLRPRLESGTMAAAFWKHSNLWHITPDFDQAAMDGSVELQFDTDRLYVQGIGSTGGAAPVAGVSATETGPGGANRSVTYGHSKIMNTSGNIMRTRPGGVPEVFAELAETGVRLSLANIELAKQTAAFAKLRDQFSGLDDEHIIDLLMEGIRVPDEAMKQPILLDKKSTIFGYSERHAMDGPNLEKSVTTGATEVQLRFRTPPMNTGGVIMITCEIVPEQLFERQYDAFLGTTDPATLPNFLRDYLDPEKVEVVPNKYVDVKHSVPNGTFGYAPLNHQWKRSLTRIGGRYWRATPDAFVEDRQRFWSVEQVDPTLTTDFYLVGDLPHTVFADMVSDPFEVLTLGNVTIAGNTVFGKTLDEDQGNYEMVAAQVDTKRIVQTPPAP